MTAQPQGPLSPPPDTRAAIATLGNQVVIAMWEGNRQVLENIAFQTGRVGLLPELLAQLAWWAQPDALETIGRHIADGATHAEATATAATEHTARAWSTVHQIDAEARKEITALVTQARRTADQAIVPRAVDKRRAAALLAHANPDDLNVDGVRAILDEVHQDGRVAALVFSLAGTVNALAELAGISPNGVAEVMTQQASQYAVLEAAEHGH